MAHTQTPWLIQYSNGVRKTINIVSSQPLFEGASIPVRIATMHKLKSFAGDAQTNAELVVLAVNAWGNVDTLRARIAELVRS